MKNMNIPEAITAAAVSMLAPYFPGLTPAKLESAMSFEPEDKHTETLLSRREAAAALRISIPTTDRMLQAKELARVTVRGRVFVRRSEIDRIISGEQQEVPR